MKCTVLKPLLDSEGRPIKPGASVDLNPRVAESFRLQGKVKFAPVKSASSANSAKGKKK